jgi:hypothetical protein
MRFYDRLTPPVLRRPVESTQYLSIRYTERLAEAGIEPSVGSTGRAHPAPQARGGPRPVALLTPRPNPPPRMAHAARVRFTLDGVTSR